MTCLHCAKQHWVFPAILKRGEGRFCSRPCHYAYRWRPEVQLANFWSQVNKTEGCWLWTGWKINSGYGEFGINRRRILAHRFSYQLAYGDIPAVKHVCHHCDVPLCVNPDHLFLGTDADNVADKVAKGRQCFGAKNRQSKLTEEAVREIRRLFVPRKNTGMLAERFGVDRGAITAIMRGQTWKHVK